ncbi:SRPBCC family protein [Streptomyces sedi]|uniref:SRPBCC family protein n=1 Tax=Streptomyces sedi TaxID=555059 RepID=A0A5C4VEH3_9ACTN|nr:SRPBCC family protein [Streptomyces sedi]TNM33409.1 hypothetical protein FH715_03335 [Streptomyces sedi]
MHQPNERSANVLIDSPSLTVFQILLEPRRLAEWNPAFLSVSGPPEARVGTHYPIRARGGLSGHWEYHRIEESRVEGYWEVPGLVEHNTWELSPHGDGTRVRHSFAHQGALAALLRPAFANVADLRLGRLAERAQERRPVDVA